MGNPPTVWIEAVEGYANARWLRWASTIDEADVRAAFHDLTQVLNAASGPVHVLVDLRSDPRLPLQTTILETMNGPFMHRNMGRWLVIGSNHRAEIVASVITKVGRRASIAWFKTDGEALAHLGELEVDRDRSLG